MGGQERQQYEQTIGEAVDRFDVRFINDLTTKDRVTVEGHVYDIQAIEEIGRREGLTITASKRADQ